MILHLPPSAQVSHSTQADSSSQQEFERRLEEGTKILIEGLSSGSNREIVKKVPNKMPIKVTDTWSHWTQLPNWDLGDLREKLREIDRRIEDFSFDMHDLQDSLYGLPPLRSENCDSGCRSKRRETGRKVKELKTKIRFEKFDRKAVSAEIKSRTA